MNNLKFRKEKGNIFIDDEAAEVGARERDVDSDAGRGEFIQLHTSSEDEELGEGSSFYNRIDNRDKDIESRGVKRQAGGKRVVATRPFFSGDACNKLHQELEECIGDASARRKRKLNEKRNSARGPMDRSVIAHNRRGVGLIGQGFLEEEIPPPSFRKKISALKANNPPLVDPVVDSDEEDIGNHGEVLLASEHFQGGKNGDYLPSKALLLGIKEKTDLASGIPRRETGARVMRAAVVGGAERTAGSAREDRTASSARAPPFPFPARVGEWAEEEENTIKNPSCILANGADQQEHNIERLCEAATAKVAGESENEEDHEEESQCRDEVYCQSDNSAAPSSGEQSDDGVVEGEISVDIDSVLKKHQEILFRRNQAVGRCRQTNRRGSRGLPSSQNGIYDLEDYSRGSRQAPRTIGERWKAQLELLPEDFFTSKEALLQETGKAESGVPTYKSVPITEGTSEDMRSIYQTSFMVKHQLGQSHGAYENLKTAVGQFARICICLRLADKHSLYQTGKLFGTITQLKAVQAYTSYFQIRCTNSTVSAKSMLLRRLATHAEMFFSGRDPEMRGRVSIVSEFLKTAAASHKNEYRRESRRKKNKHDRLERMVILQPDDFARFLKEATKELDLIMSTCRKWYRHQAVKAVRLMLIDRKGMIEKWALNFLIACVLASGGQRPQVFGQLQVPTPEELKSMTESCEENGFFEICTDLEKTVRSAELPNVIFPVSMLRFVRFHMVVMRPTILYKHGIQNVSSSANLPLLLDTRTGRPLESRQVTGSLRHFLTARDPEMSKVTTMSLRGSYASMMIECFQKRKILKGYSENEFLEFLSKAMNTSVEQLRTTYASTSTTDYHEIAREITSVLEIDEYERRKELSSQSDAGFSQEDDDIAALWNPTRTAD